MMRTRRSWTWTRHGDAPDNAAMPVPPGDTPVPGFFRPRLTLQTLTRGDGLLG